MSVKGTIEGISGVAGKITDVIKHTADNLGDRVGQIIQTPKDIKYIKEKNEEIKSLLATTNLKLDPIREQTNKKLEEFGAVKVNIFETTMSEFSEHMKNIQNLDFKNDTNSMTDNNVSVSKKELEDMEVSIISIKNILKNTTGAGVSGAVSAGAVYSAVAAFGTASTGTLISTISGAAASNATLAWLGGGAIAAGGGGIALGTIVLGGIVFVPAVTYLIWKGKFNYANERTEVDKSFIEAKEYAQNVDNLIKNLEEITRLINNAIVLIKSYSIECNKLNKQTDHIRNQISNDYDQYTLQQKGLIQKHTVYGIGLSRLLNTPVMNDDGSLNQDMVIILKESNKFLQASEDIEFINFKKKVSIWIYVLPIILGIGVLGLFLFRE